MLQGILILETARARFFSGMPEYLGGHVLGHVMGNLISAALLCLAYLTYRLWQDYVATILCAFLMSQALHKWRARLVSAVRALRDPESPPLLVGLSRGALGFGASLPSLVVLSALLSVLILIDSGSVLGPPGRAEISPVRRVELMMGLVMLVRLVAWALLPPHGKRLRCLSAICPPRNKQQNIAKHTQP